MILSILCVVLVLWFAVFRFKRRRMYLLASKVPSLKEELPLIGIAHTLTGNTEEIMYALQRYSRQAMTQGGWATGWLGHILYFACVNPVDLEVILKTCLEKDDLHRFIRNVLGNGGIFAPETAMGVKVNSQSNPDSPFLIHMNKVLNLVCERIFHLWLQPDWLYRIFPRHKEHDKGISNMHCFTDEVIKKKREELRVEKEQQESVSSSDSDLDTYHIKPFLDLLITLSGGENGYTDTELREEVLTLTLAATDTSAVAVGYTLQLLAKYPEVQEKVYQELSDVFGDSVRPLVKDDLSKLQYLERVVKESLRLFPPVPFIIRKVVKEIKLPTGITLPSNSGIVISIWGLHRDPKYWGPDADHFDPDRFSPEKFTLGQTCSYMPFSSGPRNCLGYQYALMSIKTVLSAILRRFKVVGEKETYATPHIRVKLDITMKAVDGYQVALERRHRRKH